MLTTRVGRFFVLMVFVVCATASPKPICAAEGKQINVVTTIPPLAEFIEQIGGEHVNVTVMVPATANVHTYEPKPDQLKALSSAQLYVAVGSGIEFELAWLDKLRQLNSSMHVLNASRNIVFMAGVEGSEHERQDPHVWLSPENAKKMSSEIAAGLSERDPQHTDIYAKNLAAYLETLGNLQKEIERLFAGMQGKYFMSSHSAWRYFARDYGLREIAIEADGKEPGASQVLELIKSAQENRIKTVFAVTQSSQRYAETISREIKGQLIPVNPLRKDYIANMREFSKKLAESLQ